MDATVPPDAPEAHPHEADVGRKLNNATPKEEKELKTTVRSIYPSPLLTLPEWNDSVDTFFEWLVEPQRFAANEERMRTGGEVVERAVLLGCLEEASGSTPAFADGGRACTSALTTARIFGQAVHDNAHNEQHYVLVTGHALLMDKDHEKQWEALASIVESAPAIASQLGAKAAAELPHAFASHWHQLAMKAMTDAFMEKKREDFLKANGKAGQQLAALKTFNTKNRAAYLPETPQYRKMMQAVRQAGRTIIESLQVLLHIVCVWSAGGMLVDPQSASTEDVPEEDEAEAVAFFVQCLRDGTAHAPALSKDETSSDVPMISPCKSIDHDAARGRSLKYKVYDATLGTAVAFTKLLATSLVDEDEETLPVFADASDSGRFPFSFGFATEIAMMDLETPPKLHNALAVYANAVRVVIKEHNFLFRMSYSDPLEVMTAGWAMGMVALRRLQYAALRKLDVQTKIKEALELPELPSPEATLVVACVWLGAQGDMATRDRLERQQGTTVGGSDGEYLPSAFAKMLEPQFHSMLKPTAMAAGMQDNVLWMMWRSAFCASEATGFEAWLLIRRLAKLSSRSADSSTAAKQHVLNRRKALPMAGAAMAVLFAGPCAAGMLQQNAGEALALASCFATVPKLLYPAMNVFWTNTSAWEWMLRFGDLDSSALLAPLFVEHFSTAFGASASGDPSDLAASALREMGWPVAISSDGNVTPRKVEIIPKLADAIEERVRRFFRVVQLALERAVTRPMLCFAAAAAGDWESVMNLPVATTLPTPELLSLANGVQTSIGSHATDPRASKTRADFSVQLVPFEMWLAMLTTASLTPAHVTSPRAAEVICELCAQVQMLDCLGTTRQPLVRGLGEVDHVFDKEFAQRVDGDQELKARESLRLLTAAQATNALTASLAHLVRRIETSGLTETKHNFLVVAYLTGNNTSPMQLYARCVSRDTAKCVHATSEERNTTSWEDFVAVPSYDYWAADYHQSPHAPESVAAAHMSRGLKNAVSSAFERRAKVRMAHTTSSSAAKQELLTTVSEIDELPADTPLAPNITDQIRKAENTNAERVRVLRDEDSMTPQIVMDAEAVKALHTMAVGPHWHTLPKLDEITHKIVKYIVGRKAEAEITERCTDIITVQCEITACCFVPKFVVLPLEEADYTRLYPDVAQE